LARNILRSYLLCIYLLVVHPAIAVTTDTYYDKDSQSFITESQFIVAAPPSTISAIVGDFANYNRWALNKINGNEAGEKNVLTYVNYVNHIPDEQWGSFLMNFDLRLVWPFGTEGATINYTITNVRYSDDGKLLEGLTISLTDQNFTTREFVLELEFASQGASAVQINFNCRLRLAAWLNFFFTLDRYRHDIEWRLLRVAENLRREATNGGQ
jgi:hypothetical protein